MGSDHDTPGQQRCGKCKQIKDLIPSKFSRTRDGFYKTCIRCIEKIQTKANPSKENADPNDTEGDDDKVDEMLNLSVLDLGNFLEALTAASESETIVSIHTRIRVAEPDSDEEMRGIADELAESIWQSLNYRFTYQSFYAQKKSLSSRFMYNCAQINTRKKGSKKGKGATERDKYAMETFPCNGWLHITLTIGEPIALVKLTHEDDHVPYWRIDVPKNIQEFVKNNPKLTATQLWDGILEINPEPKFPRKAVSRLVSEQNSHKWKRCVDEVQSAQALLQEATTVKNGQKGLYTVEPILLPTEESFTALAFALPEILRRWGGRVREISLDSAWNTNKSNYEVYALLGEFYGSGFPLGYLLIQSHEGAQKGGKERFITHFLNHFKVTWDIRPIVTLTDKDIAEINAFRTVYPDAKHQLCFWHCLRAIKT
ncbi:hypothetical protein H0H92_009581, partial [Tricholoma furcatifolium]